MGLTTKQAHVLSQLERVQRVPYKLRVSAPGHRFQLDGSDCSQQVTSLAVRKRIMIGPDGALQRCLERSRTAADLSPIKHETSVPHVVSRPAAVPDKATPTPQVRACATSPAIRVDPGPRAAPRSDCPAIRDGQPSLIERLGHAARVAEAAGDDAHAMRLVKAAEILAFCNGSDAKAERLPVRRRPGARFG